MNQRQGKTKDQEPAAQPGWLWRRWRWWVPVSALGEQAIDLWRAWRGGSWGAFWARVSAIVRGVRALRWRSFRWPGSFGVGLAVAAVAFAAIGIWSGSVIVLLTLMGICISGG